MSVVTDEAETGICSLKLSIFKLRVCVCFIQNQIVETRHEYLDYVS